MYLSGKPVALSFKGCLLAILFFLCSSQSLLASANTYEAALPAELKTAKNMCALVDCLSVFPGAKSFSDRMGQPPYVEAYGDTTAGKKQLLGYVMLSTDITDTPAYSGKPVVTLIGMDTQ
ncbi:MAG: 4Fe-4S binding protein, partial [Burkholderiales bacterium]|nr:4Fe-4S binding protein [Burkholderiales bacterium]